MAICQKSWEPSFWEVMNSFFISICKFGSFKNPFEMITSLSKLYFKFIRFILLVQIKKWFLWTIAAAQAAENHEDEWGSTWYFWWGIYTSISTWAHSQNSLAAAEALSLKASSHGTSLEWSQRLSQSAQEVISNAMKWGIQGLIQKEKVDICAPQSVHQCREHPVSTPEKMIRIFQWRETHCRTNTSIRRNK